VQFDPMKQTLIPPGTKHLKLKRDILPSSFAFKFNLRRSNEAARRAAGASDLCDFVQHLHRAVVAGRGLHSSTFQLSLGRF
jgi:hypothetical protein